MKKTWILLMALLLVAAGALAFRLPRLTARPFHGDEAIHAVKFGELWDSGHFEYDPTEYHGPTLHYFTLPVMWITGRNYMDADETYYRIVPAIFGVGLIPLLWLVRKELGHWETLWAGLFTAISSAMVFYSRYYIQEMLLVFFTFGAIIAGCRYARGKSAGWAILGGLCMGMMHATKETWIIQLAAMGAAAVLTMLWVRWIERDREALRGLCRWGAFVIAIAAGVLIASLFLSGFFVEAAKAPTVKEKIAMAIRGPWDSVLAYETYLHRGTASGDHDHPWDYYLKLLAYTKYGRLWFSEGLILALAAVGGLVALISWPRVRVLALATRTVLAVSSEEANQAVAAETAGVFSTERIAGTEAAVAEQSPPASSDEALAAAQHRQRFWLFVLLYTLIVTAGYSVIRYKTPWCMLGFLHGMILLAGIGAAFLVRLMPHWALRAAMVLLIAAGSVQLGRQACQLNFKSYADRYNPYVYSHPGRTMYDILRRIEDLAKVSPQGRQMTVKVFTKDIWPIPWYLRHYPKVWWWPDVQTAIQQGAAQGVDARTMINGPVVITTEQFAPAVAEHLRPEYANPDFFGLRPHVVLIVHVRSDLWQAFLETQKKKQPPATRPSADAPRNGDAGV